MKTEGSPLVSIIAINYNNAAVTCDMLRSLQKLTYDNIEVIVVDNASLHDPTPELKAIYPGVNVIASPVNLGFAGGNNLGIKAAHGDFYFLVNNDTELTPGIIQPMLDIFEKYPDAGAASPKFHYYFHPGVIEYAGYEKVNFFTARNRMVGSKQKDNGQYNTICETHYVHGGAVMIPKKVVEVVGLMPEEYFLYYEELDWSEQIKRKGFKLYYQPNALIYHKESMSTGKNSPLKTYYINRNRILFMRRNAPLASKMSFYLYLMLFTIPKNVLSFVLRKEYKHLKAFVKGIVWNIGQKNKWEFSNTK